MPTTTRHVGDCPVLSPDELANMRMEWERVAFGNEATLSSPGDPAANRTHTGGYSDAWEDTWVGPAGYHPMSEAEALLAAKIEAKGEWTITVPFDTPANTGMRCVIDGRTFEITGILEAGTFSTAKRLLAVTLP